MGQISGDWQVALKDEFHQPYYAKLYKTVMEEYRTKKIFPPPQDMFNAFEFTPLNDVKVVILGQDPYHNDGQANGLCFSVREDVEIPPSLVNIYKELHSDLGCYIPDQWLPGEMGEAGSSSSEHSSDCACPSGQFPQGNRLGTVYRCGDPYLERPGPSYCVSSLGKTCPDEESHVIQSEAAGAYRCTSKPAVCVKRIFRMQAFQPDQ